MADARTILIPGNNTGSLSFTLPPGVIMDVEAVLVNVDATGAANAVTAELQILEQSGVVIAAKPQASSIAAGTSAKATWALRLDDDNASGFQTLNAIVDGEGSAVTTGVKGDVFFSRAYTITEWTLLADQSGSVVVDLWKDTYANYPPTVADSITASAKPTISSAQAAQSTTLTGWTTRINAGDTVRFNIDSATTVTRVCVALTLKPQ
jgi:ribosome-binding ATPase YchF (GTP1/OBG family)